MLCKYIPSGSTPFRSRILGRNPDKSLKSFPPCYSHSPLELCLEIYITSNSRNLLHIFSKSHNLLHTSISVTVHCKGERRKSEEKKPCPFPYGFRNPYRNLNSENSQDCTQEPQRNCTFMNSAAGQLLFIITASFFVNILCRLVKPALQFRSIKNFQSTKSMSQKMSFSSSLLAMQSYENLACSLHTAYTKPRILAGE